MNTNRTIRIKTLSLTDWRAQNRRISFGKTRTVIKGRNKSGKSTTLDALNWLLTGCDSYDRSNYQLFDNTVEYTKENSVPAIVEGVFVVDDLEYTLRREARIGWTRPRGTDTYVRKGSDDYSFYIDGVEVSASDYKEWVESNIAPVDKLKFILNIEHYLSVDWQSLRKHFAEIIGDVSDSEYQGDFSDIFEELKKYTLEQLKSRIKSQYNPLKDAVKSLPITIETLTQSLPDVSQADKAAAIIESSKSEIKKIDIAMQSSADSVKDYVEKRNAEIAAIADMQRAVQAKKQSYIQQHTDKINAIKIAISEIDGKNAAINARNLANRKVFEDAQAMLAAEEKRLESFQAYRKTLLEKNEQVKSRIFGDTHCAYCGQPLPQDRLTEAMEKFNAVKDAEHKAIVADGKANNERIESSKRAIAEYRQVIERGYEAEPLISSADLQSEINALNESFVPYEQTDEYKAYMSKIAEMESAVTSVPEIDNSSLTAKKDAYMAQIAEQSKLLGVREEREKMEAKIVALKKELKDNAAEMARLEGMAHRIVDMEKQKAEIIKHRIRRYFDICDIQMEEQKKDGTKTPACNITVDGVRAQVSNTATQMMAGVDISNAMCRAYHINFPLFVDNAERLDSDNRNISTKRQFIMLSVEDTEFSIAEAI